jgi:hypothetical protein
MFTTGMYSEFPVGGAAPCFPSDAPWNEVRTLSGHGAPYRLPVLVNKQLTFEYVAGEVGVVVVTGGGVQPGDPHNQ